MFSSKVQKFIDKNKLSQKDEVSFLSQLHKLPKAKRFRFMDILFSEKQELQANFHQAVSVFASTKAFTDWYFNVYLKVYSEWFMAQFSKNSIEKCLELIPCITPWTFEKKCPDLEIGKVPDSFGTKDTLLLLIDKILMSDAVINFKKIKDLEITAPETLLSKKQLAGQKADALAEKTKVLKKLLKENMDHSFHIKIQDLTFSIHPLFNPLSNKLAVRIKTPDKKNFILKVSLTTQRTFLTDEARKAHENQLLRADSPYSNALVDFYLKFNHSPMVADIQYYNFNYDAVLYGETKGKNYRFPNHKRIYPNILDFNMTQTKEISDLGLFINDVNEPNFIVSSKTKMPILIDSGHISYVNPLNPGHPGITFTLGNLSGRDSVCHFGVLLCKQD